MRFQDALQIDVPASWREDNVTIFSNGGSGESAVSLVLRREPVDPRTTLSMYVDLQLVELAKSLPAFNLINRENVTVGGTQGSQLTYRWVVQGVSYSQMQVIARASPQTMICIMTSSSTRNAQEWLQEFKSIVGSAIWMTSSSA
ncbi:MAG: DcrB-related protein [Polyangiaceae bacterium]|nr:DcrB-related protein [Polyangiaceae bacterium]